MQESEKRQKQYIAIDLKSFYASVECVERGLDPLTTNLVVADASRTEKTICLAVSPSLKEYGISGRARLFEVVQRVKEVNKERLSHLEYLKRKGWINQLQIDQTQEKEGNGEKDKAGFRTSSYYKEELEKDPTLELSYITAPPRMAYYMEYSSKIYEVYLKYVAPEDMHIYSIDEVFLDVTQYLRTYNMTASELAMTIIKDILRETGITATAGIGTNLYLCKIAMDIVAKHAPADENGVRMASLDEMSYRRILWDHKPITDFWRVGHGYAKKLAQYGMYTMGDVALCSIGKETEFYNEELLYKLFGINAELLIDHAWGYEPCEMKHIKAYRPENNSISSGQVLKCPYDAEKAKLITREMTELLVLDLVDKGLMTDQMVLTIGYDRESLTSGKGRKAYTGEVKKDHYGRRVPKHGHGSVNLDMPTSSTKKIMQAVMKLYDQVVDPDLLIRRVNIVANHVVPYKLESPHQDVYQMELFTDYEELKKEEEAERKELEREHKMQKAVLDIQKKFGKNAVLKGMNLTEGATTMERNQQIGGHKA